MDLAESQRKLSSFVKNRKVNYPVLRDSDESVYFKYKFTGIPSSLLVTPDGTVLGVYSVADQRLFEDIEKAFQ